MRWVGIELNHSLFWPLYRSTVQSGRAVTQRALALLLAAALTLGPLLALHFGRQPSTTDRAAERVLYLSLLQAPSAPRELIKPAVEEKAMQFVRSPQERRVTLSTDPSRSSVPDSPTLDPVQSISAAKVEAAERPSLPASAPIKLDLATIRAASRAAKSDVRNLAESSGAYFGDQPLSKSEKLANAVTRTAKKDCLGPNPGGSLLSAIDIAFNAARDKCK